MKLLRVRKAGLARIVLESGDEANAPRPIKRPRVSQAKQLREIACLTVMKSRTSEALLVLSVI